MAVELSPRLSSSESDAERSPLAFAGGASGEDLLGLDRDLKNGEDENDRSRSLFSCVKRVSLGSAFDDGYEQSQTHSVAGSHAQSRAAPSHPSTF